MSDWLTILTVVATILSFMIGAMALIRDVFNITVPLPKYSSNLLINHLVKWFKNRRVQRFSFFLLVAIAILSLYVKIQSLEAFINQQNNELNSAAATQGALERANNVFLAEIVNNGATQTQLAQSIKDLKATSTIQEESIVRIMETNIAQVTQLANANTIITQYVKQTPIDSSTSTPIDTPLPPTDTAIPPEVWTPINSDIYIIMRNDFENVGSGRCRTPKPGFVINFEVKSVSRSNFFLRFNPDTFHAEDDLGNKYKLVASGINNCSAIGPQVAQSNYFFLLAAFSGQLPVNIHYLVVTIDSINGVNVVFHVSF